MSDESILTEQLAYYRARAREYDEWFFRQGRYDRGAELNARWHDQVDQVRAALQQFAPAGEVLELACGTGLWTGELLKHADGVTAVDAAAEILAIHRERIRSNKVRCVLADLFAWRPDRQFDVVFFAFWLSHVPEGRFDAFWESVAAALKPDGRVFFVDSLYNRTSKAKDHRLNGPEPTTVTRRLNDGSEYRIVKVFYEPADLAARLRRLGWDISVHCTRDYFLFGDGYISRRSARR